MRLALLIAALLALPWIARADDSAPAAPVTDPTAVRQHYREVAARPEFRDAGEDLTDLHWDDYVEQWLRGLVSRFNDFEYSGQFSGIARVLVVIVTLAALAALVRLIFLLSRRRRDRDEVEPEALPGEKTFLTPRQYEQRLRRALEERDWHGAWLAAWLQLLARLENRRLVEADRSRTNREYLTQLRAQTLPPPALPLLARLVDDYDRFIYGRRPIDEAGWSSFRERIDEVTLMLGLRERTTEEPA